MDAAPRSNGAKAEDANHLAWLRTKFAVERTFMAWVRTTAAMIGFGFTMVEFFSRLDKMPGVEPAVTRFAPVALGLLLVGSGVVALAITFVQYLRVDDHLHGEDYADLAVRRRSRTPSCVVAAAVEVAGLVALSAIVARVIL